MKKFYKYQIKATGMLGRVTLPERNRAEALKTKRRWLRENRISRNNAGYTAYKNIKILRR